LPADPGEVKKISAQVYRSTLAQVSDLKPDETPSLTIIASKKGSEEYLTGAFNEIFNKHTVSIGGANTTNSSGIGQSIADSKVVKSGFVIATLFSSRKLNSTFISGYAKTTTSGKVTEVEGRLLKKIDGRPAQEVYKEWVKGEFDHIKPVEKEIITAETASAPLAKKITLSDGQEQVVTIRPQRFLPDGSLYLGGAVTLGETLFLTQGTKDALILRAAGSAKKAMVEGKIKLSDYEGGLLISCAGASGYIGFEEGGGTQQMVDKMRKSLNGKAFIGGFASSEIGDIPGYGMYSGNLMNVATVFSH
jgi:hypothetical protein